MTDDKCVLAITEALKKAQEIVLDEMKNTACNEKDMDIVVHNYLSKTLGVQKEPCESCDCLLEEPVTEKVCRDFYEQRRWVMCTAHRLLKKWYKEGKIADFSEALDKAWEKLKSECAKAGYEI